MDTQPKPLPSSKTELTAAEKRQSDRWYGLQPKAGKQTYQAYADTGTAVEWNSGAKGSAMIAVVSRECMGGRGRLQLQVQEQQG
jgi:hypothetical protein